MTVQNATDTVNVNGGLDRHSTVTEIIAEAKLHGKDPSHVLAELQDRHVAQHETGVVVQVPFCDEWEFIDQGRGARTRDVVTYDAVPADGGYNSVEVAVELTEYSDGTGSVSVSVLAGGGVNLSTVEARQVAENLNAAADVADQAVQR